MFIQSIKLQKTYSKSSKGFLFSYLPVADSLFPLLLFFYPLPVGFVSFPQRGFQQVRGILFYTKYKDNKTKRLWKVI